VVDSDGVRAFDADGTERWESRLEGRDDSVYGVTEVSDVVYASSTGGLYALDTASGDRKWEFEENLGTPTVTDDAVYGTAPDLTADTLYALDPSDGTEHWRFEIEDGDGPPFLASVDDETCYLWRRGDLHAVGVSDGTERWSFETDDESLGFHGRLAGEIAYVWSRDGRTLYALDARSGTVEWQFEADTEPWYTIEVVDDAIVFETEAAVYALDAIDGTRRWRYDRKLNPKQFLGDAGGGAVYSQDGGALSALDVEDGSMRWEFAPDDEEVAYARRIGDTVYAGTNAGTLYALDGPAWTPIDAAVHDLRTNAGAVSLVSLLGGGLAVAGYRRLQDERSDEEPGDAADAGIEFREPIDADGPLESYEARLPDGRDVVAKRLSEDANIANDQFLRAVETWAELDHENVRAVLDWGTDPAPWVAFRESTGESVGNVEEMPVAERVETLAEACEAVHAAHRRGVTHGHLSPNDVRLPSQDCQPADVRVGGWLAQVLPEEDWRSAYAAPEQADDREADLIRTDICRLGAVAYHAVTGQPPDGDATERTPPTELNAEVPTELDDVLADALAADPDERYGSALKFGDMLRWAVRQ
jgi:outer membrane protein assembly factor BamB